MEYGSAQGMYARLESERHTILERARDASRLTIPTLVVDEGHTATNRLPTPYQSVGARGVNNMASALLLSLLPPNTPFFRLVIDQAAMNEIEGEANGAEIRTQFDMSLAKIERSVAQEIETRAYRVSVFEALRQLIVAGNVLIHLTDEGSMRVIPLTRYVVKRDAMGNLKTVIVKETMSIESLPEDAQAIVASQGDPMNSQSVDLYTCLKAIPGGGFFIHQEVAGTLVPDSVGQVNEEDNPFIVLRMNRVDGEDYGRGYVEQYIGDLKSLEGLMQSIVEGSAAAAKVLFLVAPNGTTRIRKLAEAPNGGIVEGSANDVSVLQLNKQADFATAYQVVSTLQDRLSYAFLLTDNAIRNAERVTAAEVRLVTQSIERQLGGIYSVLSQEFQLPLVNKIMTIMARSKRLPKLPNDLVHPAIVTGVEALGRGNDLNKMDEFLLGVGQLLGPEVLGQYVNLREYMDRRATALGIDSDGLIKSEEQMQQEQQQAQQQAQMQSAMMAMGPAMAQAGMSPPQM